MNTLSIENIILSVMEMESGCSLIGQDLDDVQQCGYVNDPDDPGGLTSIWGFTQKTLDRITSGLKSAEQLTVKEAYNLYLDHFFKRPSIDRVHDVYPALARTMFNLSVHGGTDKACRQLQELLNLNNNNGKLWSDLTVDGKLGRNSFNALNAYAKKRGTDNGSDVIFVSYAALTSAFYFSLIKSKPVKEKYFYGWMSRIERDIEEYYVEKNKR